MSTQWWLGCLAGFCAGGVAGMLFDIVIDAAFSRRRHD